jgi:hypothetical protein
MSPPAIKREGTLLKSDDQDWMRGTREQAAAKMTLYGGVIET